jgi:hypothetical protein
VPLLSPLPNFEQSPRRSPPAPPLPCPSAPPLPRPSAPCPSAPPLLCPPAPPLPCSSAPCALLPCDCMAILPPISRRVKSASGWALMRCVWAEKADCRGIGHRAGGGNVSARVRGGEAEEGLPVFLGGTGPDLGGQRVQVGPEGGKVGGGSGGRTDRDQVGDDPAATGDGHRLAPLPTQRAQRTHKEHKGIKKSSFVSFVWPLCPSII